MKTKVYGIKSVEDRENTRSYLKWLGESLMGKRLANNCTVRLFVRNKRAICMRHPSEFQPEAAAYACWEDNNHMPREFIIDLLLDDDEVVHNDNIMTNLAHEMVHVKQWARNELKDYIRGDGRIVKWHGDKIDLDSMDYYDYPWEAEAYDLERELFVQYTGRTND